MPYYQFKEAGVAGVAARVDQHVTRVLHTDRHLMSTPRGERAGGVHALDTGFALLPFARECGSGFSTIDCFGVFRRLRGGSRNAEGCGRTA